MIAIYVLKRTDDIGYDEMDGFVVVAHSEQEARSVVGPSSGDEGCDVWRDPEVVTCTRIGVPDILTPFGIVLDSFNAG